MKELKMSRNSRRVTFHGGTEVSISTETVEAPEPGEVRIASALVGLCGPDLHAVQSEHPFMDVPYAPGHAGVGTVDAVGERVTRVVVGGYNICDNLAVFGCQTPGAMSYYFLISAARVHVISRRLPDAYAALIEPLATPAHAVTKAGIREESKVGVLGAGTIGLLVAL